MLLPCIHLLETTSSQKTHKCPTTSFLATVGLVKLFHKIPWFFHDYSGFLKFHDFFHAWNCLSDFPGFPWFPELVRNLKGALAFILFQLLYPLTRWINWYAEVWFSNNPVSQWFNQLLWLSWNQMLYMYLKQCGSWSASFSRSQLIQTYTVFNRVISGFMFSRVYIWFQHNKG